MSIKMRVEKIKEQAKLVNGTCLRNKNYLVVGMRSVTNNAINYQVKMVYLNKEKFEDVEYQIVECTYCQDGLCKICQGSKSATCRHFLAAFLWANQQKGRTVDFFDTFSEAVQSNGKLVKLVSSGHTAWAVISQDEAPGDGGLKASDFDSGPTTEYKRMLKQEMKRRGRILADGSYQSNQERQQANMREYYKMVG